MVSLRDEAIQIINDYGSRLLIIERDQMKRCNCVDSLTMAADKNCPICIGSGFVSRARETKARMKSMETSLTSTDSLKPSVGAFATISRYFYFRHDDLIKEEDYIIITDWENDQPQINNRSEICKVTYVDPIRGDNGRIEYLRVIAFSEPTNTKIRLNTIMNNSQVPNYFIGVNGNVN